MLENAGAGDAELIIAVTSSDEVNLNGIVASPDGRWLIAVQLATGQLWRIDTRTRAVAEVALEGGPLPHGDGLVLRGATDLFVVRNEEREVVHVMLSTDGARGRVVQRLTDPRLRYPTTAALVPEGLAVVNGQLDRQKGPPPLLPFLPHSRAGRRSRSSSSPRRPRLRPRLDEGARRFLPIPSIAFIAR